MPGCTVAALDRVRSIILVVRPAQGVSAVRTVAADTSSRTSFAYTRILFEIFWKVPAVFIPHPPDLESMLAVADAALLIGDPALLALEDKDARALGRASACSTWIWLTSGTASLACRGCPPSGRSGRALLRRPAPVPRI